MNRLHSRPRDQDKQRDDDKLRPIATPYLGRAAVHQIDKTAHIVDQPDLDRRDDNGKHTRDPEHRFERRAVGAEKGPQPRGRRVLLGVVRIGIDKIFEKSKHNSPVGRVFAATIERAAPKRPQVASAFWRVQQTVPRRRKPRSDPERPKRGQPPAQSRAGIFRHQISGLHGKYSRFGLRDTIKHSRIGWRFRQAGAQHNNRARHIAAVGMGNRGHCLCAICRLFQPMQVFRVCLAQPQALIDILTTKRCQPRPPVHRHLQ